MRRLVPLLVVFLAGQSSVAAEPTRPAVADGPLTLSVEPANIVLDGPRATQQVLVTGRYQGGVMRDLTRLCTWAGADDKPFEISASGLVQGREDGESQLVIRVAGLEVRVPVTVRNTSVSQPVSFRREFVPVLSAAGCSDIRCHGAPSGKNGFRLSLWGSDPALDHQQLTRDALGRRTDALAPENSLILLKALARIPHVGRQRFTSDSRFATLFRDWQAEGLRDEGQQDPIRSLRVTPALRVLRSPARTQQLAVRATFSDGREQDVTQLTAFSSTDTAIADVDRTGLVEFKRQGEVAVLCRFLDQLVSVRLIHVAAPPPGYRWPDPAPANYVDQHVFAKLKILNIAPSEVCTDEEFVRRIYLDLLGVLPQPEETRAFVESGQNTKRERLVDRLLHRTEFVDLWTKKWMDVLRGSRDSIQLTGAQAFHAWIREKIESDTSLAEITRSLLTSEGESYNDPASNFYCAAPMPKEVSDPDYLQKDLAEATAQLFLGVRLQCAQCHNHPYERWTQHDYLALASFFSHVKRSRLGKAGPKGRPDRRQIAVSLNFDAAATTDSAGKRIAPRLPGAGSLEFAPRQDRRQVLADWLTDETNPYFAKSIVNRVWFHLFGRGIVEPVDDFRDSNPPANDELLQSLADEFAANGFLLKPLIRTIVNSKTYQLSSKTTTSNANDDRYFSHVNARPLPAEVLMDAISEVSGVPEVFEIKKDYISGVPSGSVRLPTGTRAVQLPVTDVATLINTSGKYVRYELHPFLRIFGQPNRTQTCECDRQQQFGRKQALELTIGSLITHKLSEPKNRLGTALAAGQSERELLWELYERALSRPPSDSAAKALLAYVADASDKRHAWEDVLWTLLNSQEFIYQH